MKVEEIQVIVDRHRGRRGELIGILEDIQSKYSYLPEEVLRYVSEKTGRPLVDLYGIATFYRYFSLKPRGRHLVSCCQGTACHVRGAPRVADELQRQLGVQPGGTTPDREFTLETVNCLGACALGPVVVSDGHYFPSVNASTVKSILDKTRQGLDTVDFDKDARVFPVDVSCPRCNHSLMDKTVLLDGYPTIRVTITYGEQHGSLRLSSLYGSHKMHTEVEIPPEELAEFFCPHCHTHLSGASGCPECGASMVPMIVRQGGVVQICPRRTCRGHLLDLR